jgi:hypothetical protein
MLLRGAPSLADLNTQAAVPPVDKTPEHLVFLIKYKAKDIV